MLRSRRALLVLAALALAGVALVLCWYLLLRDSAEPASVERAVASFRERDVRAAGEFSVPTPESGVYVYATSGFESVDALLGSRHDYPEWTTITVEPGGCGLLLRWDALVERSTTWDVCPGADGWAIARYSELHRFFGRTERTTYVCEEGSLWAPASQAAGTSFERRCSTGNTSEVASGRVVGVETLRAGDDPVTTVHLALLLTLSGRTRGTGTIDLWLAKDSGLVVALQLTNENASSSAIGDVRYEEVARLELDSLEPYR